MMTKALQLMCPHDISRFPFMPIAREMTSKGEIQELVMEIINEDSNEYCLQLLCKLVTYHIDIMREELIAKGGIRFLLTCLASFDHYKKFEIINSGLFQTMALDVKGAEEMMADNGIQVFMQLLVVGLNDNNGNYFYFVSIVDIIKLLVKGLEDPMKLLMSLIDDIDVLEIHKTLLHRYYCSFLPKTLDVNIDIAKEWLNSLGPPFNAFKIGSYLHENAVICAFIQLSEHRDIASMIMANEGILERFLIQLSMGDLDLYVFKLLGVVLQHERVATQVLDQQPSFIKELLQLFPMERTTFYQNPKEYSVASLLFILAKHGGVFIKLIVNSGGIIYIFKKKLCCKIGLAVAMSWKFWV